MNSKRFFNVGNYVLPAVLLVASVIGWITQPGNAWVLGIVGALGWAFTHRAYLDKVAKVELDALWAEANAAPAQRD